MRLYLLRPSPETNSSSSHALYITGNAKIGKIGKIPLDRETFSAVLKIASYLLVAVDFLWVLDILEREYGIKIKDVREHLLNVYLDHYPVFDVKPNALGPEFWARLLAHAYVGNLYYDVTFDTFERVFSGELLYPITYARNSRRVGEKWYIVTRRGELFLIDFSDGIDFKPSVIKVDAGEEE